MKTLTKRHKILLFMIAVSTLLFFSCKQNVKTFSKTDLRAIVEKQNEELERCFKDGNANKLADMYADSAKLSPNGFHFIKGRDSIRVFWIEDFKSSKVLKMETNILTVDGDENFIYETGITKSEILYNDSVYRPRVKYINIWCRQPDGKYKLDVDFWNKDSK